MCFGCFGVGEDSSSPLPAQKASGGCSFIRRNPFCSAPSWGVWELALYPGQNHHLPKLPGMWQEHLLWHLNVTPAVCACGSWPQPRALIWHDQGRVSVGRPPATAPVLLSQWQFPDCVDEIVLYVFCQASSDLPCLFIPLFIYLGFLTPTVHTALPRSSLGSLPCSTLCQPTCFVAVQRGPGFTLSLKKQQNKQMAAKQAKQARGRLLESF